MVDLLIFIEAKDGVDRHAMRDTLAEWREEVKEVQVVDGQTEKFRNSDLFMRAQTAYSSAWNFVRKLAALPDVKKVAFAIVVPNLSA